MELDPQHPLNFMTLVEGDTFIPVTVTAIVAFGFVSSSVFINAKPGAKRAEGAWALANASITSSSLGGRLTLFLYRLYCFGHLCSVLVTMLRPRGLLILYYYTNWSFVLEILFFFFAAVTSLLSLRRNPTGKINWLGIVVVTLFHVAIAVSLIVDLLHWGVLYPILSRSPDPARREHFRINTFSWTSYNTHVLNFVFMVGELLLNRIPLQMYLIGFAGLFSSSYALWAFSVYTRNKRWVYPFLNASKPWALYVYMGIYLAHWIIFGLTIGLFYLRDRLLGTKLSEPDAGEDAADDSKKEL